MKFSPAKVLSIGAAGAMCFLAVFLFSCGPTSPTKNTPLNDLVISNQINGWVADSAVGYFVDSTIANFVDGGSSTYCGTCSKSTLKEGFQLLMSKSQSVDKLKMLIIDYGTSVNAKAEFDKKVQASSWTTENALSPFAITDVFFTNNSDGVHANGHFNNFFIELVFSAYGSSSESEPDASTFINYFHSKIVK